ncbi:hypothetical protein QTP88_026618 [Uroleucon formosanum]
MKKKNHFPAHLMSNTISGEMIVWFSVIIATIGWCVDCYIEDLCLNCNLYPDSAERTPD